MDMRAHRSVNDNDKTMASPIRQVRKKNPEKKGQYKEGHQSLRLETKVWTKWQLCKSASCHRTHDKFASALLDLWFPPGMMFLLMILYFPIGVFLIVCRVLIALHTYMIVCLLPRALGRRQFVRWMLGVLGVHIWVDEDQTQSDDEAQILVSNYTSVLDHIVIDVVITHIVPYHGNVPAVVRWVLGYKDLGSSQGNETFKQNIHNFVQEHKLPILFHPEEIPTNNTVGLLKFQLLPFEMEVPVRPVSIQMSRLSFPCALTTVDSPKWTDVLWLFFTPVTVFKVKTHPVIKRGEEESVVEFAERTRTVLSEALGLKKTEFTAKDVHEYIEKLKTPPPPPPQLQTVKNRPPGQSSLYGGMGNSGSCLDSVDAELKRMIQQVIDVLPQVPLHTVKQDLEQTKDVDVTISNLLEGRVEYSKEEAQSPASSNTLQDKTLFKAETFSKNPNERHYSLEERKQMMLESARQRYKLKHGIP